MRRSLTLILVLVLGTGHLALGQDPEDNSHRADSLRGAIQERFARIVQEQLGLSDDQAARMRTTALNYFGKRRNLEIQERRLKLALASQMRPGVAADQDSVSRLMDALLNLKVSQVQSYKDELREMNYLSPVQRAQFFLLREHLIERVQRAQEDQAPGPVRRRLRDQP